MYDGNRVVEHGFLVTPQKPAFVSQTGTGAILPDGTYSYLTVYAWRDKWGQVHRSVPSPAYQYVVTGGPQRPTFEVATTAFTLKTDVEIEVYRTEVNGTVFYKLQNSFSDRIMNDPSVPFLSFTDTLPDSTLIENEVLYTTGGTLENIAADSSKYAVTYKNRVFLLSSDGTYLEYSKLREQNGPVEFNDALKIMLNEYGGPGVCLGVMDDHIIIFKEQAIYALTGEGPNNLGEQDDFRAPYLITSDVGCVDPNSVVTTPMGLMFKSQKGIYMMQRGFAVNYLGSPVEKYNDDIITSSTLLADTNQVRFTTDNSRALVYDYFHNRWSTFTNIQAVDATIYKGIYTYLRSFGDVLTETNGLYSDNGSFIKIKIVSAWIHIANVQGFERFYKLLLLGNYLSPHKLEVAFSYNYNPTFIHNVFIDAEALMATPFYGENTYGDDSPYGGDYPLYQWLVFPKVQKCQAFRFLLSDVKTTENGASCTISNFASEIGIKEGLITKSDNKSFGVS
jgi:hypothetical protein